MMKRTLTAITALTLVTLTAHAQNWPQWRGPTGNGVAAPGKYPVKFSATDDILWKVQLPGKGGSTPIVWKDRILLTSGIGEGAGGEDGVLCFDWAGKLLWQVKLGKQSPGKHRRGSGSCPSIVTDGERLFAYFKTGTLAALDLEGKVLWKTNLQKSYGPNSLWWDLGTSPVLADGNVVVAVMHEGDSYMVALSQATGKETWKIDRNYPVEKENHQSYTTPLVTREGNRTTLVVWGADHLTGHSAATGKTTWQCGGFNPGHKAFWRTIASPAMSQGIAVVPYGRGEYLVGVKVGGSGDITKAARLWEKKGAGTDASTPVASGGKVYLVNFKGKAWCLDIQTGKEIWQTEIPRAEGVFYSSPTLAGNKMYLAREGGTFYVCEVNETGMQILNQTEFDDHFVATPVLLRDRILLRGEKNLYCIGK
jgi:outer membrane protein assembly factor BamB